MTTAVPVPVFTPAGFVSPAESDIRAGVMVDLNAAFGGGLDPGLTTPQGQLSSSLAAIIGNVDDLFVYMSNQFNPMFAEGRWQDGLAAIYFITRNPALPTVVNATCSGLTGVVIPAGALAQAGDGNVYICTSGGTIPHGGSVSCEFTCTVPGPIACPAGDLSQIYQAIPGWDSVTNATDGVIGQNTESRSAFEARRFASVSKNSIGALPSVLGAVLGVPGILDAYVTENPTGGPITIGGMTLAAHSIYVAAVGGTDDDVARAIWTKKAPGCDYNGNTTVVVLDTSYAAPQPSYNVTFERPTPLPVLFAVNIVASTVVPADAAQQIQAAIIAAFAGQDGGPRATIGRTIFASRYYAPVALLGPWAQIIRIQVGAATVPSATFTGHITGAAMTVSVLASGAIAIGQTITDDTGIILPGTTVLSGSGTAWTLSQAQPAPVTSETMYGVLANQNDVAVNINQSPNVSADNIVVTAT